MKIEDVNITQKSVDDFFDSIDTEALVNSIKLSYKSNKGVENMEAYQEYLKTKANIENITADLEMTDEMVSRARQNLLYEFERACQAIKCYEDHVDLQQHYLQRSYAYEDALDQLGVHYGALTALRDAIHQVDWQESYSEKRPVKFVPFTQGEK